MTGSQDKSQELSQELEQIVICKDKSPGATSPKTPTFLRKKLVNQIRNSPSAAARLRAIQLLKEKKSNKPDLYRDELDLVTPDERALAAREITLEELFRDICLFIDVRTGEDNRSNGISDHLTSRGINVTTDITKATHIIFKDGLKSTYTKGKELNLPFVSLLWIDHCKKFKALVDYNRYPVVGIHKYDDPILSKKIKRKRSMQPAASFVPRTPKRKRRPRTKVTVEKPLIHINHNNLTPVQSKNCTLTTPKTIEVTVKAKNRAHACTKLQKDRKTVYYSSDEMEVSASEHKIFTWPNHGETKRRQTRVSTQPIIVETPVKKPETDVIEVTDVNDDEIEQISDPKSNERESEKSEITETNVSEAVQSIKKNIAAKLIDKGPVNSTCLATMDDTVPHFEGEDISAIVDSIENICSHTPSPMPTDDTTGKSVVVIEKTKHVNKPCRKRKLFNPNLTPDPEPIVVNAEPVPTRLTPANPYVVNPVLVTKKSSDEAFEAKEKTLLPLKTLVAQKTLQKTQKTTTTTNTQCQSTLTNRSRNSRIFVTTGVDKTGCDLLKSCIKELSRNSIIKEKCEIHPCLDKKTTHLIMQEPYQKTQKLFLAILHGIWVVNINYLKACIEKQRWLPEEAFEAKSFLPGIALSRAERETFGTRYKMRLFSSTKIYVCPELKAGATEISEFVELADGKLVKEPSEAQYQIRDEVLEEFPVNVQVASSWITDSIGAGHLKNVRNYLIGRRLCSQSQMTQS